jgi:hypothetical protein
MRGPQTILPHNANALARATARQLLAAARSGAATAGAKVKSQYDRFEVVMIPMEQFTTPAGATPSDLQRHGRFLDLDPNHRRKFEQELQGAFERMPRYGEQEEYFSVYDRTGTALVRIAIRGQMRKGPGKNSGIAWSGSSDGDDESKWQKRRNKNYSEWTGDESVSRRI